MNLENLTDEELGALATGDLSQLSDRSLQLLSGEAPDTTSMAGRFGKGFMDPIDAGAQLLERASPKPVAEKLNQLGGSADAKVRSSEREYQRDRGAESGKFDAWRLAGNVANPVNLLLAARAPQAVGAVARLLTGAGVGGASAGLTPVTNETPDTFWKDKGKQVATGAAFGAAAEPVMGALSRVASPRASTNPELQLLMNEGVQPTIGQTLGGMPNRLEQLATSVPIMGDAISAARRRAQGQFENAAINRSQAPINQRVEGAGFDAVNEAHQNVSRAYDDAKAMLGGLVPDQQFGQDVAQLRQLAQGLTPPFRRKFEKQLNDLVQSRRGQQTGGMTAETFKRIDSDLGTEAATYQGAKTAAAKEYGDSIAQLQDTLTQAARRSNPQAADAFARADEAFANLVRVEAASRKGINDSGRFTPGQLNQAMSETDRSARKNQSARGESLMQDLSNAGQSVLGNRVPDSGTAGRLGLGALALGTGALHLGVPAALVGGAVAYTPALQSAMRAAATRRPQSAQRVAGALTRAAPRLMPAAGLTGLEAME